MPLQYPAIDSLIAQFEGFGKPGVPATVNNNPGNIIAGKFATAHGATGANNGFAVFPDPATGSSAMDSLVSHYDLQGLSIADLIAKWSPGSAPGNTPAGQQSYTDFVASGLGVPSFTSIGAAEKKTPDSGASTPSGSPTVVTSPSLNPLTNIANAWGLITGSKTTDTGTSAPFSFARIGAFILGFIFIAAGLFMFRPVQQTVIDSAKGLVAE